MVVRGRAVVVDANHCPNFFAGVFFFLGGAEGTRRESCRCLRCRKAVEGEQCSLWCWSQRSQLLPSVTN